MSYKIPFRPRTIAPLVCSQRSVVDLRTFRWSDLAEIMDIERQGFPSGPLSELRMREILDSAHTVCTIAERSGSVAGFSVARYCESTIRLLAIAVSRPARRLGVGSLLVDRAKRPLEIGRWIAVETVAPLYCLPATLFLQANGFRAVPDHLGRYVAAGDLVRFRFEAGERPSNFEVS